MASSKKWIAGATKKEGQAARALHVPKDEKIPPPSCTPRPRRAARSARRRRLAETLKGPESQNIPNSAHPGESRDPD